MATEAPSASGPLVDRTNQGTLDRSATGTPASFMRFPVAALIVMFTYWTVDILAPALPSIKEDLALSAKGAGLVFSLMFLGRLFGNFPASYLLGRVGSSLTAAGGAALLAAGSLGAAAAPNLLTLTSARILQGFGISLLVNAGLRSILHARPGRGTAMTVFGIAATVGGILGLQSGGFLTDNRGWRAVFAFSAVLSAVLFAASLASHLFARRSQTGAVRDDSRTDERSIPVRQFLMPLLFNFLIFCNYSIWVVLPIYAERKFDATAETTASLLLIITIVHLVVAIPAGRLIQRIGAMLVLSGGLLTAVAGTLSIVLAPNTVWMALPLMFYGSGMVAAVNAAGDIVLHRGGGGGRAVGVLRLASDLGLVIGPFVAGALADAFGYGAPFVAFPIVMFVAALATILRPALLAPPEGKGMPP